MRLIDRGFTFHAGRFRKRMGSRGFTKDGQRCKRLEQESFYEYHRIARFGNCEYEATLSESS